VTARQKLPDATISKHMFHNVDYLHHHHHPRRCHRRRCVDTSTTSRLAYEGVSGRPLR